jgi:type IV secretory pathway VirB6-like protein
MCPSHEANVEQRDIFQSRNLGAELDKEIVLDTTFLLYTIHLGVNSGIFYALLLPFLQAEPVITLEVTQQTMISSFAIALAAILPPLFGLLVLFAVL